MEEEVAAGEENAMGRAEEEEESEDVCVWSVICNGEKRYEGKKKMKGSYLRPIRYSVCAKS